MTPRIIRIGLVTFTSALMLSACSKKPAFETPEVIIDSPSRSSSSSVASSTTNSSLTISSSSSAPTKPTASNPPSVLINVPFSPQAPDANWDALHEEACEEMSLIMVHHFLEGTPLSLSNAETEVQAMIAWESANGYGYDVTAAELGEIAKSQYGYRARVLTNVTADMIRKELAAGHPVIMPAAGRTLGNPYFSGAGPWYHMLVIIGYNDKGFITNDPGTRRGEKYFYATDVIMNAIHDWTGVKEEIETGGKTVLVVE